VSTMIAFCGLTCAACPVHLATLEPDADRRTALRRQVVRLCREQYGLSLRLDEVTDCDGCTAGTGRLFAPCRDCAIRACALATGVATCADCPRYPCDPLERAFREEPERRTRLDALRAHGDREG
jgi:hypothetical protein